MRNYPLEGNLAQLVDEESQPTKEIWLCWLRRTQKPWKYGSTMETDGIDERGHGNIGGTHAIFQYKRSRKNFIK